MVDASKQAAILAVPNLVRKGWDVEEEGANNCRNQMSESRRTTKASASDLADVISIEAIIAAAYDVISGPAGKKRDWARERSLFISGARLIPTAVEAGRNDVDLAPQI